jgi:hypothetical protein
MHLSCCKLYIVKQKNILIAVVLSVIVILGTYVLLRNRRVSENMLDQTSQPKTITLNEYSGSGQSGIATLTNTNGQLKVELILSGYESSVPQPAHIHTGNCPRIGPVLYDLTDVVDGQSITLIDTTYEKLISSNETLNVNVHKSYDDFKTYTSCGDLK